jgi:hypothetical protein
MPRNLGAAAHEWHGKVGRKQRGPAERPIDEVGNGGAVRRHLVEPPCAPDVERLAPARQRCVRRSQRGKRPFLRADDSRRVIGIGREFQPDRCCLTEHRSELVIEERQPIASTSAIARLPPQVVGSGADQAVPGHEVVIEERQWTIGGKCGEPEREAGQLHRHRIHVDAVETARCNLAPERRPIGCGDIRRMPAALHHQCLLE